ncbi:MAG: hypothetical protein S4CHLAM102_15480 [Chlamydiia bacterium]|nr:hypothetical protein [Chlamydiia bacterium]
MANCSVTSVSTAFQHLVDQVQEISFDSQIFSVDIHEVSESISELCSHVAFYLFNLTITVNGCAKTFFHAATPLAPDGPGVTTHIQSNGVDQFNAVRRRSVLNCSLAASACALMSVAAARQYIDTEANQPIDPAREDYLVVKGAQYVLGYLDNRADPTDHPLGLVLDALSRLQTEIIGAEQMGAANLGDALSDLRSNYADAEDVVQALPRVGLSTVNVVRDFDQMSGLDLDVDRATGCVEYATLISRISQFSERSREAGVLTVSGSCTCLGVETGEGGVVDSVYFFDPHSSVKVTGERGAYTRQWSRLAGEDEALFRNRVAQELLTLTHVSNKSTTVTFRPVWDVA